MSPTQRRLLIALGSLLVVAALACAAAAPWLVGPNSARLVGTAAVLGFAGVIAVAVGVSP